MGQGLGKFQQEIVALLHSGEHPEGWTPSELTAHLFALPDGIDKRQTRRALEGLQKRGLAGRSDGASWTPAVDVGHAARKVPARKQAKIIKAGVLRGLRAKRSTSPGPRGACTA